MFQNPNFPGGSAPDPAAGACSAPQTDPLADGERAGSLPPAKNPTPALRPSGLVSTGLRVQPTTELAMLLMIDFKCRPIWCSHFSVSENEENGLGDEGADGAKPPPEFLG